MNWIPARPGARRRVTTALASAAVLGVVLAGCGDGGVDQAAPAGGTDRPARSDYSACLMVSSLGVADRSFNQQAWGALQSVASATGIQVSYLAQSGSIDYPQMGDQFVQQGCDLIVGMGFNTTETIERLAPQNPDIDFVLIDDVAGVDLPNVSSLHFRTDEASFQAGYLAAGMSKTGTVGVVGNVSIPPVELYLDGFVKGVEHYNQVNGTSVKSVGWDPAARTGTFVGNFTDANRARLLAESEMQLGADVLMVLMSGGGTEAVRAAGGPAAGRYLIWPDNDGCVSNEANCDLFLTSVLKNIQTSLTDVATKAVDGALPAGTYEGTVENGGVGLAPFHQADAAVPQALRDQLTQVGTAIVAGSVQTSAAG